MKVSVILCVYNEEKFIRKAIEGILKQSLTDFEFIIVNDGSTDDTLDIINSYDDERIRLIDQPNMGLGASRNRAIDLAQGEYVIFLDGDDWFRDDALEIAYSEAKSLDTDISIFQIKYFDDDTGEYSDNDWFNLNSFDESFDGRVFSPEECRDFLFDLSVNACQKIYKNTFDNGYYRDTTPKNKYKKILTEDSKAGYQFFEGAFKENKIECLTAGSKSNIYSLIKSAKEKIYIIADGAAFGCEIDRVLKLEKSGNEFSLYLPESFEWMILKSGLVKNVDDILDNPSQFIESKDYASWERFFTALLIEKTKDGYLAYKKAKLNPNYLHEKEKEAI